MRAPSSPSLPLRNPTNPQMRLGMRPRAPSPSEIHLRTPRRVTFCKRRGTLLNKLSQLCRLTGARAAVIVLSSTGRLHFSGGSSVEEMEETCFDDVRCNGGAMPPMGPKEGLEWVKKRRERPEIAKIADQVQLQRAISNRLPTIMKMASELCTVTDARAAVVVFSHTGFHYLFGSSSFEDIISDWFKKQCESCVAKEDFDSLNLNYEAVLHHVREKLKDVSGGGNSGVGAGCDSEGLNDDDIDSLLQRFEASHPLLFAHFKDYVRDSLVTAPVNSAVASGSSGKEPMQNLSENNPSVNAGAGGHSGVGVGHDYEVLNDDDADWLLSFLAGNGNCDRNGGSDSFLTSPVNLAAGGGSSGVESTSTLSDLEGRELVDSLFDFCSGLDENDCLIPPENSTVQGRSSGEEQGYGYNPDIFSTLEDLNISLEI